jgi:hypothetical protein
MKRKPEYFAYRYEGGLNGIEIAAVLLPHPKESFGKPAALRAFICIGLAWALRQCLNIMEADGITMSI